MSLSLRMGSSPLGAPLWGLLLLLARAALLALLVQADGKSVPASGAAYNEQALRLDLRAAGVTDGKSKSRDAPGDYGRSARAPPADARACSQPPRHRYCKFSGTTAACAAGRCTAAGLTQFQMNMKCPWRHNRAGLQRPKRARKRTHGCIAKGRGERARAQETQARGTPMLMPRPERGREPRRPKYSGRGTQTRARATRQTCRTPRAAAAAVEAIEGVGAAGPRGRCSAGWECWHRNRHRNRLQGSRWAIPLGAACSA